MSTQPTIQALQLELENEAIYIEDNAGVTTARPSATRAQTHEGELVITSAGNVREIIAAGSWRRVWKAPKGNPVGQL